MPFLREVREALAIKCIELCNIQYRMFVDRRHSFEFLYCLELIEIPCRISVSRGPPAGHAFWILLLLRQPSSNVSSSDSLRIRFDSLRFPSPSSLSRTNKPTLCLLIFRFQFADVISLVSSQSRIYSNINKTPARDFWRSWQSNWVSK